MSCQPVFNPRGDGQTLVGADKLSEEYIEWQLFNSRLPELKQGNIVFLNQDELRDSGYIRAEDLAGSIKRQPSYLFCTAVSLKPLYVYCY